MARNELASTMRTLIALGVAAMLLAPAPASASYAKRTLRTGSHGRDVKLFQRYLRRVGLQVHADGQYGAGTRRAERRFERAAGRHVDGRASRRDQRLVRRAARRGGGEAAKGTGGTSYQAPAGNGAEAAVIAPDGKTAIAPDSAPQRVKDAIAAANRITGKPYRYGGGHGKWEDSGYDCSGSVSYALHGGGLLSKPRASTGLESWGSGGHGDWITVYANSGHAYTVIAGLRFDTSNAGAGGGSGPRWRTRGRSSSGYVARHPAGL